MQRTCYKMEVKTGILSLVFLISINCISVRCTKRPIIGILAQEFQENGYAGSRFSPATSYIAASYVKAVESSGARVAPIFVNQSKEYYEQLIHSINGVVIPGGAAKLKPGFPYYDAAKIIFKIANEMNKNGNYFPILAVCLGFEAVLTLFNDDKTLQQRCNIRHRNFPLIFQPKFQQSLQFSQIADDTLLYLKYFPTTMNNHVWCTTMRSFSKTKLPQEWNVIATSTSLRGLNFIASVEHKEYPYMALQFHPEKVIFEWGDVLNIPHSSAAIQANRHFYDVLVKLSKLSDNKFENKKTERNALIYNYKPINSYQEPPVFEQIYAFD